MAKKYLKGWFIVDVTSSFPFDYFTLIATRGQVNSSLLKASRALRVIRLTKLLSLLRLLRISRLLRFMQRWEDVSNIMHVLCSMRRGLQLQNKKAIGYSSIIYSTTYNHDAYVPGFCISNILYLTCSSLMLLVV